MACFSHLLRRVDLDAISGSFGTNTYYQKQIGTGNHKNKKIIRTNWFLLPSIYTIWRGRIWFWMIFYCNRKLMIVIPMKLYLFPLIYISVTQRIHVHKLHASYGPIGPMMCANYAFCIIFLNGILSMSYFVFVLFHV